MSRIYDKREKIPGLNSKLVNNSEPVWGEFVAFRDNAKAATEMWIEKMQGQSYE